MSELYKDDFGWYVSENERLQERIDELEEALCLRDSTMAEESNQFEALQGKVRELEVALAESRMNDRHAMSQWREAEAKINALQTELQAMQARLDNRPVQPIMEWVCLTGGEILEIACRLSQRRELGKTYKLGGNLDIDFDFARAIEAKLKEKNHG